MLATGLLDVAAWRRGKIDCEARLAPQ
jgi:hypothetical protein